MKSFKKMNILKMKWKEKEPKLSEAVPLPSPEPVKEEKVVPEPKTPKKK